MKNADIKTTKSIASIKTPRRVILSGTPIQNDLVEFFCMCDFVNPGVLGTGCPDLFGVQFTHALHSSTGSYASFKRVFETPILLAREPGATEEQKVR